MRKEESFRLITEWAFDGVMITPDQIEKDYLHILKQLGIEQSIESLLAMIIGIIIGLPMGMEFLDQMIKTSNIKDGPNFNPAFSIIAKLLPIYKRRIAELRDAFMKERLNP